MRGKNPEENRRKQEKTETRQTQNAKRKKKVRWRKQEVNRSRMKKNELEPRARKREVRIEEKERERGGTEKRRLVKKKSRTELMQVRAYRRYTHSKQNLSGFVCTEATNIRHLPW